MAMKKFFVPVTVGALVLMSAHSQVQQTLTPEKEATARRLMRDRMYGLHHDEWRATLHPVSGDRAMIYPATLTSEREAQGRRLVREKMAELYAQQGVSSSKMVASTSSAHKSSSTYSSAPLGTLTPERETQARQMLREKIAELYAMDAAPKSHNMAKAPVRPNSEAVYPRPVAAQPAASELVTSSVSTPQGRLTHLYVSGQIDPHTYYTQLGQLRAQR
jgi:hypothetical protein